MRDDLLRYIHIMAKNLADVCRREDDLDTEKGDFAGVFDLSPELGIMRQISPDIRTPPNSAVVVFRPPYFGAFNIDVLNPGMSKNDLTHLTKELEKTSASVLRGS